MEITFKDITRIIKKNIVFIAVLSLLCAAASYFVTTFFVPKTYTSTVKLYVETNYKSQSAYDDYQSINYAKNLVLTYIELLDSNSFYNSEKLQSFCQIRHFHCALCRFKSILRCIVFF